MTTITITDNDILNAAEIGANAVLARVAEMRKESDPIAKVRQTRRMALNYEDHISAVLGPGKTAKKTREEKTRSKRVLSPEAKKRIASAQKKRWDAFRKAKSGIRTTPKPVAVNKSGTVTKKSVVKKAVAAKANAAAA